VSDIAEAVLLSVGRRWTLTQGDRVGAQLRAGIRFLDLRLRDRNGQVWTAHRFYLVPLTTVVADVVAFVAAHPTEVVVVKLRRDWDNRPADEVRAGALAAALAPLRPYLVPWADRAVGVGALAAAGKRVVLLKGDEDPVLTSPLPAGVWTDYYRTRWHNTPWGGTLCAALGAADATAWATPGRLNWHQPILSPSTQSIIDAALTGAVGALAPAHHGSLRAAAVAANRDVVAPWLASLPAPWAGVVATDWASPALIASILRLNDARRPRAGRPWTCPGASCDTSRDCPAAARACATSARAGKERRWRCWPPAVLGAPCRTGSDCASGECGTLRRRCVCAVCDRPGCGGCGRGEVCEPQPLVGNGCKAAPPPPRSVADGGRCRRSGDCRSRCCVRLRRKCAAKKWWRACRG